MNWSDVADVEKLSEPEFTHHADNGVSSSIVPYEKYTNRKKLKKKGKSFFDVSHSYSLGQIWI